MDQGRHFVSWLQNELPENPESAAPNQTSPSPFQGRAEGGDGQAVKGVVHIALHRFIFRDTNYGTLQLGSYN